MNRLLPLAGLAGLIFAAAPVAASTTTMTYNFDTQPADICAGVAVQGPITGTMPNQCLYGIALQSVVLGDDGLYDSAMLSTDHGYVFDLLAGDIFALSRIQRIDARAVADYTAFYDALPLADQFSYPHGYYYPGEWPVEFLAEYTAYSAEKDPLSGLLIQGYRNNVLKAEQLITSDGNGLAFDPAFTKLDRVTITATNGGNLYGFNGFITSTIAGGYYYACEANCVGGSYDNLVLNIAAVPLPAGGLLLGTGLIGLTVARRRKKRAA